MTTLRCALLQLVGTRMYSAARTVSSHISFLAYCNVLPLLIYYYGLTLC